MTKMPPLVTKSDRDEVQILDGHWAASRIGGVWQDGIAFSVEYHYREFGLVRDPMEEQHLLDEAHAALDAPGTDGA
jgi:hypothetical protein